jgi:hypothetical protein
LKILPGRLSNHRKFTASTTPTWKEVVECCGKHKPKGYDSKEGNKLWKQLTKLDFIEGDMAERNWDIGTVRYFSRGDQQVCLRTEEAADLFSASITGVVFYLPSSSSSSSSSSYSSSSVKGQGRKHKTNQ